jgi:hypothetical protein
MPPKLLDHLGARSLIGAHDLSQVFRVELAGKSRRVDQVTEQYRELAAFRLRTRRSRRRGGASGSWCILDGTGGFRLEHRRGTFRSCTRITEPHEATALLLTHWMVGIEEFGGEIGEGLVVKLKLALKRSV